MSDIDEKQEPKKIDNVGDLIDALHDYPGEARLTICCMDGVDSVYLTYNKQFNDVMVAG